MRRHHGTARVDRLGHPGRPAWRTHRVDDALEALGRHAVPCGGGEGRHDVAAAGAAVRGEGNHRGKVVLVERRLAGARDRRLEPEARACRRGARPGAPIRPPARHTAAPALRRAGRRPGDAAAPRRVRPDLVHVAADVRATRGELAEQLRARRRRSRPSGRAARSSARRGPTQPGAQVGLVDRRRCPAMGEEAPPVTGTPSAVLAVDEVGHHDMAVQVRIAVAVDAVGEPPGDDPGGRDDDPFGPIAGSP